MISRSAHKKAALERIAHYTIEEWGEAQAESYLGKISQCFQKFAEGKAQSRSFSEKFPDARVVRCEHHYIFYIHPEGEKPIIFAILHERMDMLSRLKDRFK